MAFPSILLWNHNERTPACQGRLGQFLVTSQEAALARVAVVLSPLTMLKESVWSVRSIRSVWLHETNQTDETDQMDQTD